MSCLSNENNADLKDSSTKQHVEAQQQKGLARYTYFRKLSKYVFDEIDADKSGGVDEQELYTGLLLFHLYLAAYLGPAAAKPASRQKVQHVFSMMDEDKNGTLDQKEFIRAMAILSSHLISRVATLLCLTIFLVPILTQHIMNYIAVTSSVIVTFISNMKMTDQILSYADCSLSDSNELSISFLSSCAETYFGGSKSMLILLFLAVEVFITYNLFQYFGFSKALPYALTKLACAKNHFFTVLPVSAITAAPRTIISLSLGYVIIPQVVIALDKKFDFLAKNVSEKNVGNLCRSSFSTFSKRSSKKNVSYNTRKDD